MCIIGLFLRAIWQGAKPHELISKMAVHNPKAYEFIGKLGIHGLKAHSILSKIAKYVAPDPMNS